MSEVARDVPVDLQDLLTQVQALSSRVTIADAETAQRANPVRLHYIEALARRLQAAPPSVQKVLQAKLEEALNAFGERAVTPIPDTPSASVETPTPCVRPEPVEGFAPPTGQQKPKAKKNKAEAEAPSAPLSLLAQLNHHIQTATAPSPQDATGNHEKAPQDLKSAVRFRETWARISAETEVDQAANRAPENAGPLNAHNLVLRTLALMRELSPDYLRRFMSHTESLLWLDQAYGQLKQPAGKTKPARAPKAAKAEKGKS